MANPWTHSILKRCGPLRTSDLSRGTGERSIDGFEEVEERTP